MIREARKKDYEEIKQLVDQIHDLHLKNRPDIYQEGNPMPRGVFDKYLNDNNALNYVYILNDKIVGLLMATKKEVGTIPIMKKRTICFIEDIVVDKNYRKQGIGKKLYNHLKEVSKKNRINAIELNVWGFNQNAIDFYKSLGMNVKEMRLEENFNKTTI